MNTKQVGIQLKVGASGTEQLATVEKSLAGAGDEAKLLQAKSAELQAELRRLAEQQALIDAFTRQKTAVGEASQALAAAQSQAQKLGREIAATEAPTKKQASAFSQARQAAREAEAAYQEQTGKLQGLRGELERAGISTTSLASAQVRLRQEQVAVQQQVAATADWAQRLTTAQRNAGGAATDMATQGRRAAAALQDQAAAAAQAEPKLNAITSAVRGLAQVGVAGILGSQTAQLLGDVATTADEFANLQARVKLVTGEGQAFATAWEGIGQVALRTNSNLDSTATLFAKVAEAGKALGQSQQDALNLTETINQAVQLSGASAEASNAAVTQLIQGLQSGVLRGDEFNSVMEQAPRLARALADALGVTTGELRKMAEAGDLSAERVIKALQSQRGVLEKEFGSLPATIGRSLENLATRWTLLVGELNKSTGATQAVAGGINALANNLEEVAGIATRTGAVLVAALAIQGVGALRALAAQAVATAGSMGLLSAQISQIPTAVNIVVAAVGLEVGFRIGEMLRENSELARKLGVGVSAFFQNILNDLQFVAEAAKAVFTDDTIGQAFDRYRDRGRELDRIFSELWDEAEQSPNRVGAAAVEADKSLQALGAQGTAAGAAVSAGAAVASGGLAGVAKAAETADGAIGALVAAAGAKLPVASAQADALAGALSKVVGQGAQVLEVFAQTIPGAIEKLNGPELEKFRASMVSALQQTEAGARRAAAELQAAGKSGQAELSKADDAARLLRAGLDAVGRQAAKSLGVDLATASSTVSQEFAAQEAALAALVKSLPTLAKAGVDTGQVLRQALGTMIDSARNQAEIDAVIARLDSLGVRGQEAGELLGRALDKKIEAAKTDDAVAALRRTVEALGGQGRLTGDQVAAALDKIGRKADDSRVGINSLAEAMRHFGLRSGAELNEVARRSSEAWDRIKTDATVAIGDKIRAFAQYRDHAIAANRGVESSEVRVQREILSIQAQALGAGQVFQQAMGTAGKALDGLSNKLDDFGQKTSQTFAEIFRDQARYERALRESAAFGPGANGGVGSLGGRSDVLSLGARNAAVRSTIQSDWYNADGTIRSDFRNADGSVRRGDAGTIGSVYTPPPDESGDWEWIATQANPGGEWQLSASGSARRAAEISSRNDVIREAYRRAGIPAPGVGTAAGLSVMGLPAAVRDQLNFGANGPSLRDAAAPAPAPAPSPATAPAQQGQPIVINLGGLRASVTASSAGDAAALENILRQLQQDAERAGP